MAHRNTLITEARIAAIAEGALTYQGSPCPLGHSGQRRIVYEDHARRVVKYTGGCADCYVEAKDPSTAAGKAAKQYRQDNREAFMWRGARARARQNNLEFTLRLEDVVIPEVCPVSLKPFGTGTIDAPSLDRIDTDRGYTPDNIWVVSTRINRSKNNLTVDELMRMLHRIQGHTLLS